MCAEVVQQFEYQKFRVFLLLHLGESGHDTALYPAVVLGVKESGGWQELEVLMGWQELRSWRSAHLAAEDLEGAAVAPVVVPGVGHQPVGGARLGGKSGDILHNIDWLGVATIALLTTAKSKSQNCIPTNRNPKFYSMLRVLKLLD